MDFLTIQNCMKKLARVLMIAFLSAVIGLQCRHREKWSEEKLSELQALFNSKNYFVLKESLKDKLDSNLPIILYYKAAVESAFNNPEKSNQLLDQMLDINPLPDSLLADNWMMKMNNFLRLHAYSDALHAADRWLQIPDLPVEKEEDVRNTRIIVDALKNIPPQRIKKYGDSDLKLKGTHIDVAIHNHQRDYAFDTGANYSILMFSEAKGLGLKIIKAGFDVETVTGKTVKGDIAVADSLKIGNMKFSNVVFLVFPDEALTFPGGFQLRGVIGFPVLEAMGELQFRNGKIFVPQDTPDRGIQNLALENLTPLIEFSYRGEQLIGRFDSGADKSVFYEPFFRRYFSNTVEPSEIDTIKSGGVGGIVAHPVYKLRNITIEIADTLLTIDSIYVHTTVLGKPSDNYLYANIGLDILNRFDQYILNFKEMAFIIE